MKKKKLLVLMISIITVITMSCETTSTNENNENKAKYDELSAEYQLAEILCDCFENFDENDSNQEFDALECFMSNVQDGSLNDADEYKTNKIMKDICPESSANFDKWQTKIQGK